jgi:hypothetical protein
VAALLLAITTGTRLQLRDRSFERAVFIHRRGSLFWHSSPPAYRRPAAHETVIKRRRRPKASRGACATMRTLRRSPGSALPWCGKPTAQWTRGSWSTSNCRDEPSSAPEQLDRLLFRVTPRGRPPRAGQKTLALAKATLPSWPILLIDGSRRHTGRCASRFAAA